MILLSPPELSYYASAACGDTTFTSEDTAVVVALMAVSDRVASAIEVVELERGQYVDTFIVETCQRSYRELIRLRLENGFLVSVDSLKDPYGNELDSSSYVVNKEEGVITLYAWNGRGRYTVTYTSGFEEDAPLEVSGTPIAGSELLLDVPVWMKAATAMYHTQWVRTVPVSPALRDNVSLAEFVNMITPGLRATLFQKYMRPHGGVIFAETHDAAP